MEQQPIGFVVNIYTKDGKTYLTVVLNYRELRDNPLMLGEFVQVSSGKYHGEATRIKYLGMVTASEYRPVTYNKHAEALALKNINDLEIDEQMAKNINFLHYDIVLLGEFEDSGVNLSFYPSTRRVPSLLDVCVYRIPNDLLQKLVNSSIASQSGSINATLGHLRIGSSHKGEVREVMKQVDVSNFHGRRTANFGKTGLGKSNENKVILCLLKHHFPEMGMLIFDLNGEYARQETEGTSMGLIDAFEKMGVRNQIIWLTNRQVPPKTEYYEAKPIKINFFEEPYLAIELAYQRALMDGERPPQYLEAAREGLNPETGDWKKIPNKMAYVYGALINAGLEQPNFRFTVRYAKSDYDISVQSQKDALLDRLSKKGRNSGEGSNSGMQDNQESDNESSQGGARDLFQWAKRLSFLKSLHTPGSSDDFFSLAVREAINGKVVIIDLPTVSPELVEFLSVRLAARLFKEALRRYSSEQQKKTDVLIVIEEAHNLLQDPSGIFYRIAKEGRKYGIGMLYSTQSPSAIPSDILAQTENFLVKHVSSEEDVKALKRAKVAFAEPISDFILNEPVIGLSYVYMEPYQPFPVPVQVRLLDDVVKELADAHTLGHCQSARGDTGDYSQGGECI
jgi:hypothetical protein